MNFYHGIMYRITEKITDIYMFKQNWLIFPSDICLTVLKT